MIDTEQRQFNEETSHSLGRIEGTLASLAGPEGRITKLEVANTRQWWFAVAIAPIIAILHALARKFGFDI